MDWKVPLFKMYWEDDDVKGVTEVIKRSSFWAEGPEIIKVESLIASFAGRKFAVSFNSGTSALHALLLAYKIKDFEVIVPSFTFISTANSVLLAGGKPVFAESENSTYGLSYEDVVKKITAKTKAIILVHYAGCSAIDTLKIRDLCKEKGLLFIEDAAESFGSEINGRKAGSFGDSAMFSFCQNKIISCGEGGMIVLDDELIYEKLKLIRSHGRVEANSKYFSSPDNQDYIELGFNFRLSSMSAALLISQFNKVDKIIKLREEKANYLSSGLSSIKQVKTPLVPDGFKHVYQLYTISLESEKLKLDLSNFLTSKGIMSKVYFTPIHLTSFYKGKYGYSDGLLPKTEDYSKKVLTLPLFVDMSIESMNYIVENIRSFFDKLNKKN